MSSSSIIRLHRVCAETVVVGGPASPEAMARSLFSTVVEGAVDPDMPERTAAALLESARAEAAAIRAEALRAAEALREEAIAEGYREGQLAAREESRECVTALRAAVDNATVENREFLRGAEQQLVELALAIARKVIGREIALDPAVVLEPIQQAIESVEAASILRIRANPADLELLASCWEEEGADATQRGVELVADARIASGGCVVETKLGVVDAQLETKLLEIEKAFFLAAGFRYR